MLANVLVVELEYVLENLLDDLLEFSWVFQLEHELEMLSAHQ
jgi:hypothetical protein